MEAFNEYIILNKSKHRERDNHLKVQNGSKTGKRVQLLFCFSVNKSFTVKVKTFDINLLDQTPTNLVKNVFISKFTLTIKSF